MKAWDGYCPEHYRIDRIGAIIDRKHKVLAAARMRERQNRKLKIENLVRTINDSLRRRRAEMRASELLKSVLCDSYGIVCVGGSDANVKTISEAIDQVERLENRYEDLCNRIYKKIQEGDK